MKTAFIFPAFISDYIGTEVQILNSYSDNFKKLLKTASIIIDKDLDNFSLGDEEFPDDELKSQFISYIFSCSLAGVLSEKKLYPDFLAGYSMGLYGALVCSGSISFEDGIKLIQQAYLFSKEAIREFDATMGSIIGLTEKEIAELLENNSNDAEIANTNSRYSHLITGRLSSVKKALDDAREIGALNTSLLNVHTPYHSKLLQQATMKFNEHISTNIALNRSHYKIISSIDQRFFTSPEEITSELTNNLFQRINWMDSFNKLCESGVSRFIECGAGNSLTKLARFMPGEYSIYPINKVGKLLG